MASLVLDIINAAALQIGAVQSGETLSGQEAQDILNTWQRLISSSNTLSNTVYSTRTDTYTLTPGTQSYTLGTDPSTSAVGTLSPVRPARITGINLVMSGNGTPVYIPLRSLDVDEWAAITVPAIPGIPHAYYADYEYPYCGLYFYSLPSLAYQVVVYSWQGLTQVVNLSDTVMFPDGYERFWISKLAIEISPMFGLMPSPTLLGIAQESEANIRSLNSRSPLLKSDPSLYGGRRKGGYNWISGSFGL